MVFYPIRIRMCPNLLMVRPSQGHVLLIHLSYLLIRTCIGKQMDTRVCDTSILHGGIRKMYHLLFVLFLLAISKKSTILNK